MTTADASAVFVDTNVLVYAVTPDAPQHQIAVTALTEMRDAETPLWLSRQVLREYMAVLSRPQAFTPPIDALTIIAHVRAFASQFYIADDSSFVTSRLLDLMEHVAVGGKQVHDANIVATMQVEGINRLLTFNAHDFARFSSYITLVPLELT